MSLKPCGHAGIAAFALIGIDAKTAQFLQETAWETTQEYYRR
jgi:hypothetical protein